MAIARPQLACSSHNAFQPRRALWQLFFELHACSTPRRGFALSVVRRAENAADSLAQSSSTAQDDLASRSSQSQAPHEDSLRDSINPASLTETLDAHRAANRQFLVRKTLWGKPPPSKPGFQKNERRPGQKFEGGRLVGGPGLERDLLGFAHLMFSEPVKGADQSKPSNTPESSDKTPIVMEYEGRVVIPPGVPRLQKVFPWQTTKKNDPTKQERLSSEIWRFHEFMKPSPREDAGRKEIITDIESSVAKRLPARLLEVIGSQRTGLSTAVSDIDLRLAPSEDLLAHQDTETFMAPRFWLRNTLAHDLQILAKFFAKHPGYTSVVLRHARYPLISMQHKPSGLDVQIVLANDSVLSRDCIERYRNEMPGLLPVYTLIKTTFDIRGLSDVFLGGLGSYSLFMLLVAVLKQDKGLDLNNPGEILLSFLSFFGKFDTYKQGLSVDPPTIFAKLPCSTSRKSAPKRSADIKKDAITPEQLRERELLDSTRQLAETDPLQPYLLALQDPADLYNDLGRRHISIKHSQKTLKHLHELLIARMDSDQPGNYLDDLIGASSSHFYKRRRRLKHWGRTFLVDKESEHDDNDPQEGVEEMFSTSIDGKENGEHVSGEPEEAKSETEAAEETKAEDELKK